MIKLVSAEGSILEVERDVIEQSGTIRNILSDVGATDDPIPLPTVSGPILTKIIDYCRHHKDDISRRQPREATGSNEEENDSTEASIKRAVDQMDGYDHEFCRVDQGTLYDILLAANFLDIQPLLNLAGYTVANMMKSKSVEEIRQTFDIKSDFTPEEEEGMRKANAWCDS
ncbi:hypothetical protein IW140_001852 [Coemansia sp. RSA 1813]|nr:hypothetical protein EV178_002516 [Coemansia sp. RSA 1646]KAJ1772408.1 hypothetical protein LPJ74_001498 [Coemansia sp. RSA 1843]KAJ2091130.1 hypothetical protein IW138_002092 [Coemansia sp. RSA 986]KAJ2213617.1 hypothetical protein EV179_003733 [Coemansia sp. RSA 487]KAJ2571149.1 hypothetical protein IW140_001852 [Coemansia sp. RSA 1813]